MATCAPMCAWRPAALCSHALGVQKEHALAVSCVPPHASLQPGNACVAFSRAEHAAARVPLARHAHAYPCLHTGAPVPWRGCARAPTSARLANGRVGNGGPRRFRPLQLPYSRPHSLLTCTVSDRSIGGDASAVLRCHVRTYVFVVVILLCAGRSARLDRQRRARRAVGHGDRHTASSPSLRPRLASPVVLSLAPSPPCAFFLPRSSPHPPLFPRPPVLVQDVADYLDPKEKHEWPYLTPEYHAMYLDNIDWGVMSAGERRSRRLGVEERRREKEGSERTGGYEEGKPLLEE